MNKISGTFPAIALLTMLVGTTAQAASVTWDFNLPATAVASQTPPYPSVARLTLVDTVDGVQFTLDPNETNPGYAANSTVDALNIVFDGPLDAPDLTLLTDYRCDSGPCVKTFVGRVQGNAADANMDSSYKSDNGQLELTWDNPDFNVTDSSMWTVLNTTIAGNFSLMALSNSNPSPVFGIFSVSPISLTGPKPTPSNWVTGPSPVPVPAAFWLFGTALIGFIGFSRRTKV